MTETPLFERIALIGIGLMKEGSGVRRLVAAAIVVAGNLLLQVF